MAPAKGGDLATERTEVERLRALPAIAKPHLAHAILAEFRHRPRDHRGAADAYHRALALTANDARRRFLARRLEVADG